MKPFLSALIFVSLFLSQNAIAQKHTTIYVVRHAEKDLSDPANNNPPLNLAGQQRAKTLAALLKEKKIAAVFCTPYLRNLQTAEPLANQMGKDPSIYDPKKNDSLVAYVRKQFAKQSVLIIGHSNTVLAIVKAFGGSPTIAEIRDDQYNLLFTLTLKKNQVKTLMNTYGND